MAMRFRRPLASWLGLLLATLLFPGSHAAAAAPQTSTELFIDGSLYRAVLEPSSARIGMSDADRKLLQGNHYSGSLEQVPGSWVRLSQLEDDWSGVVSLNGEMHIIDSAAFSQHNNLPVARSLQSLQAPGTCGVGNGTHSSLELPTREGASARSGEYHIAAATLEEMCTEQVDGVCLLPEKYLIVDHLFQQKHPDTYQDKVVELLNIIDGFYRNDLNMVFDNLHVEFPSEELLLESTSSNELLVDLRDKYHTFPFADTSSSSPLIELLSGREFDGSTVGLAYVGTLCNTNGYATGVTQEYVNIPLTAVVMAHEIGHNFGANHDNEEEHKDDPDRYCGNGYIMSSWADGSATGFSSCSVNQMTAKVNSLGNHDACFNYPVDAGISADVGNLDNFDDISGNRLDLAFPLSYRQASHNAEQWIIDGSISNGTASSVDLAGGNCTLNADQRSYQCTLLPPFTDHAITLTAHSDNSQDVVIQQQIQSSGSEVKDIVPGNNSLSTTLAVNLTSTQPGDLAAAGQDDPLQVQLTWTDQAHGETGYRVERQIDDQSWQTLTTLAADSNGHIDTSIDTDISYQYRVTAEGDGINGTHSNLASVRIEGVPATPSGLQASLPGSGIALSWQDNADNEVAYRVDRQRQDGASWTLWTTLSDTLDANTQQYTDTTAVPGETYQYRVFALNQTLTSDASETVQIHYQTLPASPSGVSALRNDDQIDLSWIHDSDNTQTIIVERQLDGDGWQTLATLGNVSSHSDTDLQPGRTHHYRLVARNDRGDSPTSDSVSVQVGKPPAAPSNLEAKLNGTNINLNWMNNADDADTIILERRINNGEWLQGYNLPGNATSYSYNITQTGSTHYYRAFARNEEGISSPSNEVSLLVEVLPTSPSGLTAQLDGTHVLLSWSNNANNADQLRIERQLDNGDWLPLTSVAGNATNFTDSNSQYGSQHAYRVLASNAVGQSPPSNTAQVLVLLPPPPPTGLSAQSNNTTVQLRWDTPDSPFINGQRLERQADGGEWQTLVTLAASADDYSDENLNEGVYRYRLIAINLAGESVA
ncbi:MAG: hypothetical protein JKY21_09725, partial [Alcanivorax sp.]|nr:hypothetical protein [Alcanivorax sp.]